MKMEIEDDFTACNKCKRRKFIENAIGIDWDFDKWNRLFKNVSIYTSTLKVDFLK